MYSQAFHKLVEASYLKPSTVLSHQSPRDKRIQYETEEKAKISGFPTAKELKQAKEVAAARLRREEEEAEKVGIVRRLSGYSWLVLKCSAETKGQGPAKPQAFQGIYNDLVHPFLY